MNPEARRLSLSGTVNARDLGGFALPAGGLTRFRRFFRSDLPRSATDEDARLLLALGVDTVLDLRSDEEFRREPSALSRFPALRCLHRPTAIGNAIPKSVEDVPLLYFSMLDEAGAMAAILRSLAESCGGVLFHCTAGKDRTGVLSALLLTLAGVDEEEIVADYLLSGVLLREVLERYCVEKGHDPAIVFPRAQTMRTFLSLLRERYSSAEGYLHTAGLSAQEIACLKEKLAGAPAKR